MRRINPAKSLKLAATPRDLFRFVTKVAERQLDGVRTPCWEWTANADPSGYGKFKMNGRQHWAHRVAYAIFRGSIPDAMDVDHICHNPKCVNPHHLRRKTRGANVAESNRHRAKVRAAAEAVGVCGGGGRWRRFGHPFLSARATAF